MILCLPQPRIMQSLASNLPRTSFLAASSLALPRTRARTDLHGMWERYVNGELFDTIPVPSSQRPLGYYRLKRKCLLPKIAGGQRAYLHFDAINYFGRAFVNGTELGAMGPYVPYEFEVTRAVREGNNAVEVSIADLHGEPGGSGKDEVELGVSPGWEASSGIIRDVYMEYRPEVFVDNVRFSYELSGNYSKAACRVALFFNAASQTSGRVEVALLQGGAVVARAQKDLSLVAGPSEAAMTFDVDAPLLWSPARPNLYTLQVQLRTSGQDVYMGRTGFRDVRAAGRHFELNGSRLVLHGVCRHDMWKDQGFTLTYDQMRQDMQMIKMMGANFVRLVHYPHHRHIVELADELGLLVTEEPGHWNVDFRKMPRGRIDASLTVLERTIRRDWNSPSIFAWLLGNECTVTVDYLREAKELCSRLDPIRRLISFANIYNEPKKTYDAAGLDFYSRHQYGFDEKKFAKAAEEFGPDKPLVHTEWGWEDPSAGQITYERDFDRLMDQIEAGNLAGHSFWSWQDVRQYTRVDWPTHNGVLLSGVVEESRTPRERLYMELTRLFLMRRREATPAGQRPERVALRVPPWAPSARFESVDLQKLAGSESASKAWADLESRMSKYWEASWITADQWKRTGGRLQFWRSAEVDVGGATFRSPFVDGHARPLVLTPDSPEITVPVGLSCARLHILGHVALPTGYPLAGKAGDTAAVYTVQYASGATQEIPLRHGIEIARANLIHEATRIDPIATAAPRALIFNKDVVREQYQVLLFSLPLRGGAVRSLQIRLNREEQPLLVFAINAEVA
jgi:beta-glucuronidase